MSPTLLYDAAIPSERLQLLASMKGQRIQKLVRYSLFSPNVLHDEFHLELAKTFESTGGPCCLYLDSGLVIGFGEQPSLNSTVVWVECNESGQSTPFANEKDPDVFPLSSTDPTYAPPFWQQLTGQCIKHVEIIRQIPPHEGYTALPNEVAVAVQLEQGQTFVLGCGLAGSVDFQVWPKDDILPEVIPTLIGWEKIAENESNQSQIST